FMPCSSMAMALASAGPIQMGKTRDPSFSLRMTTGVFVVRSRPRWATVTSIIDFTRSGAGVPAGEILLLLPRQGIDAYAHALQLESGDLLVDRRWQPVHRLAHLGGLFAQHLRRQRLVGKGHVHHAGGMPFRRRQIDQPALAQDH